jgi:GntR family transcriptional regulator
VTVEPGISRPPQLDLVSGVPLYLQLERSLQQRIDSGEWAAGTQIPPEGELCRLYAVSRATVRQALARLTDRGILLRERGRGTFVRDASLTAGRGVTSLTAELADLGVVAGALVLEQTVVTAGDQDAEASLNVASDARLFRLRRLRTGGGRPIGIQTTLLPLDRFDGIERMDFTDRSLYGVLRELWGVVPTEATETFTVGSLDEETAAALEVEAGAPAFHVDRLTFDARGPFEFVRSVMRGDRYRIRLALREP